MFSDFLCFSSVRLVRKTSVFDIFFLWWRLMFVREYFWARRLWSKNQRVRAGHPGMLHYFGSSETFWSKGTASTGITTRWQVHVCTICGHEPGIELLSTLPRKSLTSRARHRSNDLKWRLFELRYYLPPFRLWSPSKISGNAPRPPSANHPWNGTSVFHGDWSGPRHPPTRYRLHIPPPLQQIAP